MVDTNIMTRIREEEYEKKINITGRRFRSTHHRKTRNGKNIINIILDL